MATFPGFCGGTNVARLTAMDAERAVNWYTETADAGTPKTSKWNPATPGLRLFTYLGSGAVKGLFSQDGRTFGVGGATLYEIQPGRTVTPLGTVMVNGWPATFASNGDRGHQLMVTAGGKGYIYDLVSGVFTQITDDAFPDRVIQCLYFDDYFVALDADTGKFVLSELNDGLTWNGLDFGFESQFSDRVIAMTRTHDNLWLFGSRNTAPWYDSGNPSFPFQPIQGSIVEHGIIAPFSAIELDNTIWWLQQDNQGWGLVGRANGYTPQRVSTFAIDALIQRSASIDQTVAWGYQEAGHTFLVLQIPGVMTSLGETTLVYDISTGDWHERGHWDVRYGRYFRHVANNHCFAWGKHLVGDRQSGAVYEQSLAYADDRLVIA